MFSGPTTFATLSVDMRSLDEHDRKYIREEGAAALKKQERQIELEKEILKKSKKFKLKEAEELQDSLKDEVILKLKTECVFDDPNPIYQSSDVINSFNYD